MISEIPWINWENRGIPESKKEPENTRSYILTLLPDPDVLPSSFSNTQPDIKKPIRGALDSKVEIYSGFSLSTVKDPSRILGLWALAKNNVPPICPSQLLQDQDELIMCGFSGYYWNYQHQQGAGEVAHVCPTCQNTYSSKAALVNHQQSHQGRTNCQYCGNTFSSISNLNKHVKKHHTDSLQADFWLMLRKYICLTAPLCFSSMKYNNRTWLFYRLYC